LESIDVDIENPGDKVIDIKIYYDKKEIIGIQDILLDKNNEF
jgi:hypothetical protein